MDDDCRQLADCTLVCTYDLFYSWQDMMYKTLLPTSFSQRIYCSLFSAAFQLTTSHTAEKYSALRFWYCR
jgi:hypothetical protein